MKEFIEGGYKVTMYSEYPAFLDRYWDEYLSEPGIEWTLKNHDDLLSLKYKTDTKELTVNTDNIADKGIWYCLLRHIGTHYCPKTGFR